MLDDSRLSWKAKGILSYLIGKPDDWKLRVLDICKHATEGERAVRSGLRELRDAGYAALVPLKEKGQIREWVWKVSESPVFLPDGRFADVENADVQNSHITKNDLTKNDYTKKTKETDNLRLSASPVLKKENHSIPTWEEFEEYVDTHCLDIASKKGTDELYDKLCNDGWRDNRGRPINNWHKFVDGLNATIETATTG